MTTNDIVTIAKVIFNKLNTSDVLSEPVTEAEIVEAVKTGYANGSGATADTSYPKFSADSVKSIAAQISQVVGAKGYQTSNQVNKLIEDAIKNGDNNIKVQIKFDEVEW